MIIEQQKNNFFRIFLDKSILLLRFPINTALLIYPVSVTYYQLPYFRNIVNINFFFRLVTHSTDKEAYHSRLRCLQ